MNDSVYLVINSLEYDKLKAGALKEAKASGFEEGALMFPHLFLNMSSIEVDSDKVCLSGDLKTQESKDFGFVSIEFDLPVDVVGDIISAYTKKINKIKTILEAAK